MAHLFLSYAREDRECAELLARALASRGWSVWWDRQIQVGRSFSKVIEAELDKARCVIVLWSRHAVESEWVQNEAAEAARRNVLVPVRIEDVRQPLGFRHLQTADLFDWKKGFDSPDFDACLSSIESLVRITSSQKIPNPAQPDVDKPTPQPTAKAAEAQPKAPQQQHPARTEIWISQDGKQFAAPDPATLRRWAEEGRIRADSQVFDKTLQRWVRASQVPALQSAYRTPPPVQRPAPVAYAPVASVVKPRKSVFGRVLLLIAGVGIVSLLVVGVLMLSMMGPGSTPEPFASFDPGPAQTITGDPKSMIAPLDTTLPAAADAATTVSVSLQNLCMGQTIAAAVCFLDPSTNTWISRGWWTVPPGQTQPNVVQAVGPVAYFYGEAGNGMRWEGREGDAVKAIAVPIDKINPFNVPADGSHADKSMPYVMFQGGMMQAGQPVYTYNFMCN